MSGCVVAVESEEPVGAEVRVRPTRSAWGRLATMGLLMALAGGCNSKTVDLHDAGDFQKVVLENPKPVLVDFWKFGCASCYMTAPVIEGLANEYDGRVVVAKFMASNLFFMVTDHEVVDRYDFLFFPTVILFVNGEEKHRWVWNMNAHSYRQVLDELVGPASTQPQAAPAGSRALVEAEACKLTDAVAGNFTGASGGKAVLLAKSTSRLETTVPLKAGRYEVVVTALAPDMSHDSVELLVAADDEKSGVKGDEKLLYFDRRYGEFAASPVRGRVSVPVDATVKLSVSVISETGMAVDKVEFLPVR